MKLPLPHWMRDLLAALLLVALAVAGGVVLGEVESPSKEPTAPASLWMAKGATSTKATKS